MSGKLTPWIVLTGLLFVVLLFVPAGPTPGPGPGPEPDPVVNDAVHTTFVTYERLWRQLMVQTAEKLEDGTLKDEPDTWAYLAGGQEPIRKLAFEPLALREFQQLGGGKWTPELHAQILKGYAEATDD